MRSLKETSPAARRRPRAPPWAKAPGLERLPRREGAPPALSPVWPCPQLDATAPGDLVERLARTLLELEGVRETTAPARLEGRAFALEDFCAKGQPEAYIAAPIFLILRPEGSLHLNLRPEWAARVVARGWGAVHPLARYMAGAVPPQSLVIYAPRDPGELKRLERIGAAAHAYAMGRIGALILPDTRW